MEPALPLCCIASMPIIYIIIECESAILLLYCANCVCVVITVLMWKLRNPSVKIVCVYQLVCFMDGPPPAQHCPALVTGGGRAGLLGAVTAKMGDNQDIYNAMHKNLNPPPSAIACACLKCETHITITHMGQMVHFLSHVCSPGSWAMGCHSQSGPRVSMNCNK